MLALRRLFTTAARRAFTPAFSTAATYKSAKMSTAAAPDVSTLTNQLEKLGISKFEAYPGSDPVLNTMDVFRSYITKELAALSGVDPELIYPALEWTSTSDKGDLVIPLPRLRMKGVNPQELAVEWSEKFPKGEYLKEVKPQGPFMQFFFSPKLLFNIVIKDIMERKLAYGNSEVGKGKKVVIEFSSPNIAKPFHAGHLRSTIIGGFLSNLHEKLGWEVIRLNYLGDWGKQFGVLAVGFERYGSEEQLTSDPIQHLFEVYVQINKDMEAEKEASKEKTGEESSATDDKAREYFRKMEDGDKEALALWSRFRDLSIERYKDTYARLNIHYDSYSGESQVPEEFMNMAKDLFVEKGLVHEDRGAKLIDLTKFNKKLGKVIVEKKDGTSLYITRDVGGAIARMEKYKFDKMIYVIASQQDLHCQQFFRILKECGFDWVDRLQHVNFGLVQGMSTRKGTVVFLSNILEEVKESMHNVMKKNEVKYQQVENPEEIADLVGISSVMIQDMSAKRVNNYKFDWDRMLSFEGDTGPYLQYAHSRLRSVERKSGMTIDENLANADFSLLTEPIAAELIRTLTQFPDVVLNAGKTQEPATIVTYLFKLAHQVSSCYDVLWVAGQEEELAKARLSLYSSARQVLYNGMVLLGLTPVDRM